MYLQVQMLCLSFKHWLLQLFELLIVQLACELPKPEGFVYVYAKINNNTKPYNTYANRPAS